MDVPEVLYAPTSDGLHIAYQQFGSGPDMVFIPGLVSNIEMAWEQELFRRSMLHTADHVRMLHFDKRGIGCSDRYDKHPTLDIRINDILAVLDAAGVERAHIVGMSEGGLMAAQFAIRHPDRVDRLVLGNAVPGIDRFIEYGEGQAYVTEALAKLPRTWGREGEHFVRMFVPSQLNNAEFIRWSARFQRQSGTHGDIVRQIENLAQLRTPDYGSIVAPTMVLGTSGDRLVPPEVSRRTAELIPGARYIEIDCLDHFYFAGDDWRPCVDATLEFCLDRPLRTTSTRTFATVLFTDLVESTRRSADAGDRVWKETIDGHNRIARQIVADAGGTYVKSTGDGLVAHFPLPSAAVEAASRLRDALGAMDLPIRAGLHTGEFEVHADGDISGMAVNVAARIEQAARDGEVWVSSTVRDLLLGGDTAFGGRGSHDLKGVERTWTLYAVGN